MADCKQIEIVQTDGQPFPSTLMRAGCAGTIDAGPEGSVATSRGGELFWAGNPYAAPQFQSRSLIFDPLSTQWVAGNHIYRAPPIVNPAGWPVGGPNIRLSFAEHTMLDTSGNGLNATVDAGTERYNWLTPTAGAFNFDGSTGLVVPGAQPLLALTGDMTLIFAGIVRAKTGAVQFMIGYAAIPETEADNTLYSMFYNADGSVSFISESGAGVNFNHTVNTWAEVGQPFIGGFSRASNRIQFWLNRAELDAPSAVGPTPTGGGNARFRIGAREGGDIPFGGTINGVVVYPFAITLAQWRIMYNFTMGPLYGFVED